MATTSSTTTAYSASPTIALPPTTSLASTNLDAFLPGVPGFSTRDIQNINVKHLRTADLPSGSFLWLLLPVIGWGVLIYLKIDCNKRHNAAEAIMKQFESPDSLDDKITLINRAKEAAGSFAWQYSLEAAKLHLLQNNPTRANAELELVMQSRGRPDFPGHYGFGDLGLVCPKEYNDGLRYATPVLEMTTRSYAEAQLAAAVYSANENYSDAYDALNQAALWASRKGIGKGNFRKHQEAIVQKLLETGETSPRINAILKAEGPIREQAREMRRKTEHDSAL